MDFIKIILNFMVAFILMMVVMPKFIPYLHKIKFGQVEREEGLESHKKKGGTPTMGGLAFVVCTVLTVYVLNVSFLQSPVVNLITFAFVGYAAIGFLDDYLIVVKHSNVGLKPLYKYALQSVLAVLFYVLAIYFVPDFSTVITIPVLHYQIDLGILYPVLIYFMFNISSIHLSIKCYYFISKLSVTDCTRRF